MGVVIDENAANRLGTAIDQAKNRSGHKLLVGGSVDTGAGWLSSQPSSWRRIRIRP